MLQCYDFVKCESCGMPWDEHDPACSNHGRRDERIAGRAALTDRDKAVLKAAGWTPPAIAPAPHPPLGSVMENYNE